MGDEKNLDTGEGKTASDSKERHPEGGTTKLEARPRQEGKRARPREFGKSGLSKKRKKPAQGRSRGISGGRPFSKKRTRGENVGKSAQKALEAEKVQWAAFPPGHRRKKRMGKPLRL